MLGRTAPDNEGKYRLEILDTLQGITCTDGALHLTVGLHNVVEMGKGKKEKEEKEEEEEE